MTYHVVKTFGHELGLSACFRQWRAKSHCRYLHGYSLSFTFTFSCNQLDEHGWVIDFGGLKPLKEAIIQTFDHHTCVAQDDPELEQLLGMDRQGLIQLSVFPKGVGVEKFAEYAHTLASNFLREYYTLDVAHRDLYVSEVKCAEHGANAAIYQS